MFSSDGHFFSGANYHSNFGRGLARKHFCEIILKSTHWPLRSCRLKGFSFFLALAAVLFSGAEPF